MRLLPLLLAGGAAALSVADAAPSHPSRGCVPPTRQPPVGSVDRVYAIPHGCVRLSIPGDDTKLPTVVVRRHTRDGRLLVRRFRAPDTNLPPGAAGICGRSSWYLFVVRYPFVMLVAQPLYEYGDGLACSTDADDALLWTLELTPGLRGIWHTHRP